MFKKKVQTTIGTISVSESHCLHKSGKKGFKQSPLLQEIGCYIGQLLPFDDGSEVLEKINGISLTDKQIERIIHHYGECLENLEDEDIVEKVTLAVNDECHYAMMDGSMILTRPGDWKEVKLGRLFAQSDCYNEKKRGVIKKSTYVAHLGCHEDFLEKFDREIRSKKELVAISDGARWIWDYWETYHPNATQILDYYHLIEKIGEWASASIRSDKIRKEWMINCEKLLKNNEAKEVVIAIQDIDCQGDIVSRKEQLLTYLENNKDRIHYKTYLDKGLFIGSGPIESANKNIIQKRLKLSGQRWSKKGAQQVINVRLAYKNNRVDSIKNLIKSAA
jgi:hypothetical protein